MEEDESKSTGKGGQPTEGTSWGHLCFLSAALVSDTSYRVPMTSKFFYTVVVLLQMFR